MYGCRSEPGATQALPDLEPRFQMQGCPILRENRSPPEKRDHFLIKHDCPGFEPMQSGAKGRKRGKVVCSCRAAR